MEHDAFANEPAAGSKPQYRHWRSLSDGFLVTLIIIGPTFLFEELWRGQPLIDRGGFLWVIPAAIMGIGFFLGGMISGRHRRMTIDAFKQGLLVAALALPLLFIADLIRRFILGKGLPLNVLGIWAAAVAVVLLVSGLGGINGRRRALLARKRYEMGRFF